MGYLHGVRVTVSIGLLALASGCAGSSVPEAAVQTHAGPSMTAVGVGPETTMATGMANTKILMGKPTLMQLP